MKKLKVECQCKEVSVIRIAIWVVCTILLIDLFAFAMWKLSGQTPVDEFYVGTITKHLITLI